MEPIPALEVSEVQFDETVDVVVVGLGVAGACAAVAARQAGADVLAVERSCGARRDVGALRRPDLPGRRHGAPDRLRLPGLASTTWRPSCDPHSGLVWTTTASTPIARVRQSTSIGWSRSACPFRAAFCDEPNRESADDSGLVFSGGEDTYPFDEVAIPVPRGHKPRCIDSAGGFLMERLGAAVSTSGARVVTDAQAQALIVDGETVVGVQMLSDDGARAVRVRGGIILATGGFIHNEAMVAEYCPLAHVPDAVWRIGTPNDDGRGIRLGVGVGAATTRLDVFECALPLAPPHRLARGILVDREGKRFINEDTYTGRIGLHALRDHDGFIYMITDDVIHEPNLLGLRVSAAAATPEELAMDIGVSPEGLARTVREYNEAAAARASTRFSQAFALPAAHWRPAGHGIGAIDLRVDHGAIYATFTLGGLSTDREGAALDGGGRRIPGLYAAGRTAASLAAHHYASGISLGDGSFFGRRAGRRAAHRPKRRARSSH